MGQRRLSAIIKALERALGRSPAVVLFPILALGAHLIAGERALIAVLLVLPVLFVVAGVVLDRTPPSPEEASGLMIRDGLIDWADHMLPLAEEKGHEVAVIAATIDDLDQIEERFGLSMQNAVLLDAEARLRTLLRDEEDVIARLGTGFAIGVRNVREPETENLMMLAERLQSVFEEPFSEGPTRTYCTLSLGIAAESHVKSRSGANIVAGAQRASELAQIAGPGAIRIYNDGLSSERPFDRDIARELANALEDSDIHAWFQPQVRTGTRQVIGFEALARWEHPDRGLTSPATFLPDIEKAGLSQRLAEVILKQALQALNAWDAAGFDVATVSVNFSTDELRNPKLPDYVRWELDRHGIEPERLIIEVLESVVSESSEDVISRTLIALSRIGCRVDLDDFGTGFTSFVNIRRFEVDRIKIDRSLVSSVDQDEAQHRMFSALLAFSRELGIEALAEGVETEGEVAALKALACRDMQGYVISRPMPLGETLLWLEENSEILPPDRMRGVAAG